MFKTLKKITCALAATILIIQHCTFLVFGAGDFTISLLQIRWLADPSYAANPGTTFSINAYTSNNLAEPIQSVFVNVDFGNNAGFAYQGVDQRSRINNATVTNPIPSSTYSASTGLYAEITSAGTPQVGAWQSFDMIRSSASNHAWFLINSDISTYANTMTIHYVAQKVSDASTVTGDTEIRTIYANVKPHIVDSYFEKADGSTTTNQIQGDQAESISLVLKVKDYNGCGNIDGGLVSADLSVIWLSTSENLDYAGCDVDGKTGIFKKTGISTLAGLGDKIFPYTSFYARDENSNVMDPNDGFTTFDDEDKKSDLVLTVIAAAAPNVSSLSVSDTVIGWPSKPSSILSFSGSQGGEIKVAIGSNGSCVGGTSIIDWTGSGSYSAHTATGVTIPATSLTEGSNAVYMCIRNSGGNIWSTSVTLTKDSVAPAFVTSPGFTNASVTANDPGFSIRCNESGIYQIEIGGNGTMGNGTFGNSGSIVANTTINPSISNSLLAFGANVIHIFCQDAATNTIAYSGSINKIAPTPTMAGQTTTFVDSDTDNDGLDGRDMTLNWNNSNATGYADFQSYRIYILPNSTTFNTGSQTYVKLLTDKNLSTWTGDASITKDSLGANLISGASYKACIAILGNSGQLGTEGCTASTVLTGDTVNHPLVLSAKFTSDTNLEVTTNATLDTNLSSHSGAGVSFVRGGAVTATSVASVSTNKINFTVPALGSIAATGSTLLIATGSIRANGGGYNDYFSSGSLIITDGQNPTISSFTKNTPAPYGTFYTGSIDFSYIFGENMLGGGNTRLELTRTAGATDAVTHAINITTPSELTSGNQSKTLDLSTLSLVSGTTYRVQVIGKDLAGNSVNGTYITNISYDNVGPAAPTVVDATSFSTLTPLLSWTAPTDDSGNGSWVDKYTLQIYDGATCATGSLVQTYASILAPTTSQTLTPLATNPGTYSWKITATDRMGNIGTSSLCDTFEVDTNLPTISNQMITDQTLSSTAYTKNGNILAITANINNSNTSHIWLDASAVSGNSFYNNVSCSAPPTGITCNYNAGTVTFGFNTSFSGTVASGVRQVQFRAQNTSGLNEQTALASITVDNNAPSVSASTITSPNGGEIWGGTGRIITWNAGSITDSIGLASIRLEYSTGANVWNLIANTTNAGNYVWDITSLESRGDYTIKITAFDHVGNTASDTSNSTFTIDRTAPTVPSDTLITPNGGIYRGGLLLPLLWNNASIMDGGWLLGNPITLEYSTNNGTNWSSIATSLANTGSYNWTIPSINTATALVRITATDTANNSSYDQSDSNFIIDSAVPVQTISYAGGGGNTPQSGRKINNTGLDLTLSATDAYLDQVYYQFANTSDGLFWNNSTSSWLGITTWNTLCTDNATLGTDLACNAISSSISPTILDGKAYSLILRSVDEAGNTTTSITHTYTGDIQVPSLTISNSSGSFLNNSLTFSGTSSDTGWSISSVKIEIKKGAQYWDGSAWVGSITSLLTQTSNGYANWNYVFSPPLADTDGQNYIATVTAYDNAYKVNNSTTSSITVTKDDSGPSIASDVFTFDTASMYRGNTPLTIIWNPAKISASGATLATNPITLSYNFTGTIVTIASNIANSGSYVMQLPIIDTSTAKIIISAEDTIGNPSNSVASAEFNIDSLPPTITALTTMDTDVDGQIDAIQVTMNESIKDSSITLANFSFSSGIGTPTGWITGISSNDETFILNFTNTGTTASTPTLNYTAGSLVDRADNQLANVTGRASIDGVSPRVQQVRMYDENANGKMDLIQVQFGESMQTSTAASFLINNTLAGMTVASVSRDTVSLNTFNLTLNESTTANTSVGSMTLDFTNNDTFKDTAGNSAINFTNQAIVDLAKPILLTIRTIDSTSNAKVDRIDVQFSENISGNIDGEWSIGGLAPWSTKGTTSITTDTLKIAINETSNDNDTAITPSLSYSGASLVDSSGNNVTSFLNQTVTDGVPPKLLSRTTKDFDGNGKIDAVMLTFSENLWTNFLAFNADIAGYTVSGYDSLCNGSTSWDAIICANLTEKTITDTEVVPNVQIISNTTLADTANNLIVPEITSTGATDWAGPIIIGAQYDSAGTGITDDTISLTFSENLDPATVSSLSSNDFIIAAGGAFGSSSTTNYTSGNTATITLGADATALSPGNSKISIITGAVSDLLTNPSPAEWVNNRVTVSSSVIINEVMWSNTGSNIHQYIELKNTGGSSVNINGWTIANAWGNGIDLTLPNATIAGGGIYLIAKTSESSSLLNVTPDFISNTLDLSVSQNNLVFKSGSVIYDTVKANPWPSGSNGAPSSMERKYPAGDGTVANSWYTAQSSVGFDAGNTLVRGTPGTANIFDAVSPTISSYSPQNNTLVSVSPKQISLAYSDSGGSLIDTASDTLSLQKWNGSSFNDVTGTYINIGGKIITQTGAVYPMNPAPYGKYRATFNIADSAGNATQQIIDFTIDQISFTISGNTLDIGRLTAGNLDLGTDELVVTVTTVGAGFALSQSKISQMSATWGIQQIQDFDGSNGYGFDYAESGSGNTTSYSGAIQPVNNLNMVSYPVAIDPNGNRKTYIYRVKYGAKITAIQAAGNYNGLNDFTINWNY